MKTKSVKGGTKSGPNPREKKLAGRPKFIKHNERASSRALDSKAGGHGDSNRHLWSDPGHPNEARQQVRGSALAAHNGAGLRHGEREHPHSPVMTHYGHGTSEIQTHMDSIIDKHARTAAPLRHEARTKESYALAPESRSITKNYKGANGPAGNPQARKN